MNENLARYWEQRRELVNRAIDEALPLDHGLATRLTEAMRYSLMAGGKRLRPILAIMGYELCGGVETREVLPVAVAFEFIHTFSLIHDDLPAIDNDDTRRGVPTSHRKFGEAMAILAGDALLAEAFGLIARSKLPPEVRCSLLKEITSAIGLQGVIAGQVVDVLAEKEAWDPLPDLVRFIHGKKTGSLISASLTAGGIVAGAGEETLGFMRKEGLRLGTLFQITDDILDVVGDEESVGKDLRKDEAKVTWVKVFGLEKAKADAETLAEEISGAFRSRFGESAWPACELVAFIARRTY
ncbi:MAG: polyprenyl synthetase family protein [candidate division WOR-3 bacterium]